MGSRYSPKPNSASPSTNFNVLYREFQNCTTLLWIKISRKVFNNNITSVILFEAIPFVTQWHYMCAIPLRKYQMAIELLHPTWCYCKESWLVIWLKNIISFLIFELCCWASSFSAFSSSPSGSSKSCLMFNFWSQSAHSMTSSNGRVDTTQILKRSKELAQWSCYFSALNSSIFSWISSLKCWCLNISWNYIGIAGNRSFRESLHNTRALVSYEAPESLWI